MNIEEIKQRLDESVAGQMENPPAWPVTKEKLIEALVIVGIEEETAKSMFASADPALQILNEITNKHEHTLLVMECEVAGITRQDNADEWYWRGYAEGGSIYLALILLVLCAKCYPLDLENAWGEEKTFYVNAEYEQIVNEVSYE